MSEFTWDRITEYLARYIQYLAQFIEQNPQQSHQAQESYKRSYEGLALAVAELRRQPELASNVPLTSLATLRWSPREGYEVRVFYNSQKLHYEVAIYEYDTTNPSGSGSLIESVNVHLGRLPGTVVALIDKTKRLPLT